MGAWIEIWVPIINNISFLSHPTWVRGLKYLHSRKNWIAIFVAPYMGAWIEIYTLILPY